MIQKLLEKVTVREVPEEGSVIQVIREGEVVQVMGRYGGAPPWTSLQARWSDLFRIIDLLKFS